jgi:hypothetical protein
MSELNEVKTTKETKSEMPILQLIRLVYVKVSGKILESTNAKLEKYIAYASQKMKTQITAGDVIEHALKLLFERDTGFKEWLKEN